MSDREEFTHYIDSVLEEWANYSNQRDHWTVEQMASSDVDDVWDQVALHRVGKGLQSARSAFVGPWRTVAPYLSTGFREWLEYSQKRVTFSEWKTAKIQERRDNADTKREYVESSDYCLDRLESWAELSRERDAHICEARERGASFKELTAATGLTRMAIHNVIERARMVEVHRVIAEAETITAESVEQVMYEGELVEVF